MALVPRHPLPVEILERIFRLAAESDVGRSKGWVAALSTTCKTVHKTVAPILYRNVTLTAFNCSRIAAAARSTTSPFALTRELAVVSYCMLFEASSFMSATRAFTRLEHFSGTLSDLHMTARSMVSAPKLQTLVLLSHTSIGPMFAIDSRVVERTTHLHVVFASDSDSSARIFWYACAVESFESVTHLILDVAESKRRDEGSLLKHAFPFLERLPRLQRALLRSTKPDAELACVQKHCDESGERRIWSSRLLLDPLAAFYSQRQLFDHKRWLCGTQVCPSDDTDSSTIRV